MSSIAAGLTGHGSEPASTAAARFEPASLGFLKA